MWQRGYHATLQPQYGEAHQYSPVKYWNPGLMVKTFKNCIRLESILVGLCRIRAYGGTDPLNNFFIRARSQTSQWARLFIYVMEKVARP